jgi:hypothetical protein
MLLQAVVIAYENRGLSISDQEEGGGVLPTIREGKSTGRV